MPPRISPTARQQRLGSELRKLREHVGMSGTEAAAFLGGERAQISHIESGRYGVSAERVRRLAANYSASDVKLVDALAAMAEERGKGWWEEYRGVLPTIFLDVSEAEYHATRLHSFQVANLPGLFQTEEYIRATFATGVPDLPPSELEARVSHRMQRRALLDRDAAPPFEAIIHEAALRMRFGSRSTARAQLAHMLELSERPTITVRVVTFDADAFSGIAYPMLYLTGPVPQLDTVHLDATHGGVFLDAASHLANYRTLFGKAERASLGLTDSRDFIHRVRKEM